MVLRGPAMLLCPNLGVVVIVVGLLPPSANSATDNDDREIELPSSLQPPMGRETGKNRSRNDRMLPELCARSIAYRRGRG
ncbi:uncharacterized protein B0I36DRAFT_330867 [Microdochium trichocladiopsis]|uniref:Secreted protein n=1 Tax=Microdochium trichocladiopsis TaxID=1682393 RepID=A0A9P9BR48_9PEZI|nr:uncharacterized protein B0I36DRAFT_330867 [Microdochium trichocladiopsis]KAH7026547.1 hypothetical protein B0I36DRAFT_330867 [Microdochium trichocladiopsis]